jgi:hypothetical protein
MVKVYAISLALGLIGLIIVIIGGALAENLGRAGSDPGRVIGVSGRTVIGALVGFGMGGLSAEFSTLDLGWQTGLVVAAVAGLAGGLWARYASRGGGESESDAGPV